MWLIYAFLGPVSWAASVHIDKYILEKYFKEGSIAVAMVFTAVIGFLVLPPIAFFAPGVFSFSFAAIAVMIVSGLLYMGGLLFYLYALRSEEASIVAMLTPIGPILAYALAYFFLGEQLTATQIFGGMLVIVGAFLASLQLSGGKIGFKKKAALMMSAAIVCFALSSVIFKFFAVTDSFWPVTFWTYVGEAIFGAVILFFASERKIFFRIIRENPKALLAINAVNEVVNLGGTLGALFAYSLAPLALVQAVISTTPLFVFLFAIIITVFFPRFGRESFARKVLIQKIIASAFVVAGIWLAS